MWKILHIWRSGKWRFDVLNPKVCLGSLFFFSGCVWRFIGSKSCKSEKKRNVVCFFGDACQPTKDKKLHTVRERKLNKFNKTINNTFPISSPCSQISVLFVCGQKIHGIHVPGTQHLGLWHWLLGLNMSFCSIVSSVCVTWVWLKHDWVVVSKIFLFHHYLGK